MLRLFQPERGDQLAAVRGLAVERGVQLDRLADPHQLRQRAVLELHPHPLVQFLAVPARVETEHADLARSAARSPVMHSTVVVLPAPLRPRIPKISPAPDAEAHVVDRDRRPVCLAQMRYLDHRRADGSLGTDADNPLSVRISSWMLMTRLVLLDIFQR